MENANIVKIGTEKLSQFIHLEEFNEPSDMTSKVADPAFALRERRHRYLFDVDANSGGCASSDSGATSTTG
jgi:hypothetical protein